MTTPRGIIPVLAILVAASMVIGVVAAIDMSSAKKARRDFAALLPRLQSFVAGERGLPYLTPVLAVVLDERPFERRLRKIDPAVRARLEANGRMLHVLRLLPPSVDLVDTLIGAAAGRVVGFYDPASKELVVKGGRFDVGEQATLVHELTHALEDQHFGLDRELDDEAEVGFVSLAEGSAIRVEDRYRRSLAPSDRKQLDRADASRLPPPPLPPVVEALLGLRYAFGPGLVEEVLRAGGQPGLDAAFSDPPRSTEQVLYPSKYLAHENPKDVGHPISDGVTFNEGSLGELLLRLMLETQLDRPTAAAAASGWGGDRYVAWSDGARDCVRMTVVMDTPADDQELDNALASWAKSNGSGAMAPDGSLTVCELR